MSAFHVQPGPRNGLPEWRPYTYRGTGADTITPELGDPFDETAPVGRVIQGCGTPAGYRRHHRRGERPCEACRRAEALRHRVGRQSEGSAVHLDRGDGAPRCGTPSPFAVGEQATCRKCLAHAGMASC